jgi:hypothetical protein
LIIGVLWVALLSTITCTDNPTGTILSILSILSMKRELLGPMPHGQRGEYVAGSDIQRRVRPRGRPALISDGSACALQNA